MHAGKPSERRKTANNFFFAKIRRFVHLIICACVHRKIIHFFLFFNTTNRCYVVSFLCKIFLKYILAQDAITHYMRTTTLRNRNVLQVLSKAVCLPAKTFVLSFPHPDLLEEHDPWAMYYYGRVPCPGGFYSVEFGAQLAVSCSERRGTLSFDDSARFIQRSRQGLRSGCAVDRRETPSQPQKSTRAAPGLH